MEPYYWIIAFVVLLVIEAVTLGLTTIWFAGGAFVAFILALCGVPFWIQIVVFFVVSIALLFLTRPIVTKYFNVRKFRTNYDGVIGKVAKVTEKIDNFNSTGAAALNGQTWTARAAEDYEIYEPGTLVKVTDIQGVKLIVTKYEEF